MSRKVVQVPVDAVFLERVDTGASLVGESRAEFFRAAAKIRLKQLDDVEKERRYQTGYERQPDDGAWAETGAALLAERLTGDDWE